MARNFSRAAESYEQSAVIQQNVLREMIDNLHYLNIKPERILDLGAGTGLGGRLLAKMFPKAEIVLFDLSRKMLQQARKRQPFFSKKPDLVCGDMDCLPFANQKFDLVFSNLSIHWSHDQQALFYDVHQCLREGGLFVFSGLGPETMKEIKLSWEAVDEFQHVNEFNDIQWYGDSLMRAGFTDPILTRELMQETFASGMDVIRSLRKVGVVNVNAGRSNRLMSKNKFKSFLSAYEAYRTDGLLPLSYEVYYSAAWAGGVTAAGSSDVRVPIPNLNQRR